MAERVCLYAIVSGSEGRPRGRTVDGERQRSPAAVGGQPRATGAGGRRLRLTGVGGERLRVIRMAGVEAVIGVIPRAPRPTLAAVRRYDEVERALMVRYASVLPARFGTCAATADLLAATVRDRQDSIRRTLRLVRGRVQMTVRLFSGSESNPNQPRVGSESVQSRFRVGSEPVQSRFRTGSYGAAATQGTEYLRRRREETQIPGAATLRPAVARWVRAERSERHAGGQLAGTLYHLVPRSAVTAYRRGISRAATEAGLTTIVSGPWAPYAFADVDIGS